MRRVCVFCGSGTGVRPTYKSGMKLLARALFDRGLGLVYGGGNVGLMGIVADEMLALGGEVIGVIPESLLRSEVAHKDLSQLHVVTGMHERKAMMADYADAFIAAPGGIGTLEELFEIWTWGQLGIHTKPLGFFDIEDYYAPLHDFLDHMVTEGFVRERHRTMVVMEKDPEKLLNLLAAFEHPGSIFTTP